MTQEENILAKLPYSKPFRFVDEIIKVDDHHIKGRFHLGADLDFYKGHFTNHPVTPGVILTEIMAQIGLACFGIFLSEGQESNTTLPFVMTSAHIEFIKPAYPDETVCVESEKIYFRFGKLKCKVNMKNENDETICEGIISGIQIKEKHATT